MSGAISVTAAVVAIGVAVEVATPFAIIAAVGATVGAVGAITKVKELQYAGAALGAVGLVGGLASAAGLFGEAGSVLGSFSGSGLSDIAQGTSMAETASPFASAASGVDAGTWAGVGAVGAPTGGYESVGALMEGQGIGAGEIPGFTAQNDVISMATSGMPETAGAPGVTPEVTPEAATDMAWFDHQAPLSADKVPGYESPTKGFDFSTAQYGEAPPVTEPAAPAQPRTFGAVEDPAKSLLFDQGGAPRDSFGNVISQGGGDPVGSQIGPNVSNPDAPVLGDQTTTVTGSTKPSGIAGDPASSTVKTGGGAVAVDSSQPPGLINAAESNLSGFGPTGGPLGPSQIATRAGDGTPLMAPDKGLWGGIADFAKNNQMLMYGGVQMFGSFLNGALKPGGPSAEQVEAMQAQAELNRAAKLRYEEEQKLIQQRLANMQAPMPMASRPAGLINMAGVTGRV